MKKHYNLEELIIKDDSIEEQFRTRTIFEDLRSKAIEGCMLLEREKEFLCICFQLSKFENDGHPKDFDACSNFNFKQTYLTYFSSALGASEFYKAHKGKFYIVQQEEMNKDFKYLQKECDKWLKIIEQTKHDDKVLHQLASETRSELKDHKKNSGKLIFRRQKEAYSFQKEKYILHSKFIYILVKQVIENNDKDSFEFKFLEQNVVIDSYSLIHIINRHYAQIIKNKPEKTYHIEDFKPDEIHIKLKTILLQIEAAGLITLPEIKKISFNYKEVVYRIWIDEKFKSIKGQKKVKFYRVKTFYPLENQNELMDLERDYDLITINQELRYYKKK